MRQPSKKTAAPHLRAALLLFTYLFLDTTFAARVFAGEHNQLIVDGFFDLSNKETLGLRVLPLEHFDVLRPTEHGFTYNHHPYITYFKGHFYAMWSSAPKDEDSNGQHVVVAKSTNGRIWTNAEILFADPDGAEGPKRLIAGGWIKTADRLIALYTELEGRGLETKWSSHLQTYFNFSTDGRTWERSDIAISDFVVNQSTQLANGNTWFLVGEDVRGVAAVLRLTVSAEGGIAIDFRSSVPKIADGSILTEMAVFHEKGESLGAVFRDDRGSMRLYYSSSADGGKSWITPQQTNYPDARSKVLAGDFPGGAVFLISNPAPMRRDPLVISVGFGYSLFSHGFVIRGGNAEFRFAGEYKGPGFQYPASVQVGNSLWIIYSVSKESIAVTELPLATLARQIGFSAEIRRPPFSQAIKVGQKVVLEVDYVGLAKPSFRWLRNGFQIAVTNEPFLTIPSARPSDAGQYSVEVECLGLKAISRPFSISVVNSSFPW